MTSRADLLRRLAELADDLEPRAAVERVLGELLELTAPRRRRRATWLLPGPRRSTATVPAMLHSSA